MDRRNLLASLAGIGAAGLAGCVSADSAPTAGTAPDPVSVPETSVPEGVDAPTESYVAGNIDFGLALLDRLADDAPTENRFVSPYSLGVALAMTYAGARGETRTNVAETLRFAPTGEDLHRSVAALRADLPLGDADESAPQTTTAETETTDDATETEGEDGAPFWFVGANALWGQAAFPFREAFLGTLERHYGAGLGRVDFAEHPDEARRAINGWVAERTREKIPELFPEGTIDHRTRLVLANAVYFRANWAETFDEGSTEPKEFTTLDGTNVEVPTMHQSERFPFAEVDGVKVLELPYAGEDADMTLLLPPRDGFREFERGLDADRLGELLDATESREVEVRLPRFEFRSSLELSKRLEAMGMTTAFTREANLDGMAEGDADANLKLGSVVHEAYVGVDEQGTEAAAATGVEAEFTSAALNPATFAADRPFLFVIRHRPTNAPLFLGRVADPTAD
ncbi:serpin family protein [Halorussus sp. MSC15.2]|uniref:serpin family protein n=1 Tax=Halorussus sp. MSC15.2 TaxID=2283638 RepID=UPI0013D5923F|nr:serpin family protein [Halorussus sp. MSC15.2]NEU56423.1 serpin family protein [Halorussus sp. MSC15.2]